MALNWGYLESTTREVFRKKLVDNIYDSSPGLKIMLMDKATKLQGGRKIVEPLLYAKNTARGVYTGFDTFDITPPNNITAAEYNWGNYYGTIAISGDDLDQNSGEAQVLNLIAERTKECELSIKDKMADDFYSGVNPKGFIGLNEAVGTATYAGIDPTDFTKWVSGVDATAHTQANMKDSTSTSYIHTLLRTAARTCLHLGETPNLYLTTPLIWDIYESTLQAVARYPKTGRSQKIGDAGFDVLEWRNVPIVMDEKCPAGYLFAVNTNFANIVIHPNKNFAFTGFKTAYNADAKAGQILFKGQLTLNNRRMHYKFSNLANS